MAKPVIWALVPASGVGTRMESSIPKQYLKLGDKTVIEHAINRLAQCSRVDNIIVGIAEQDTYWQQLNYSHPKLHAVVTGGLQRADTVLNMLNVVTDSQVGGEHWALVHDAVRPCVRVSDIEQLIVKAIGQKTGGLLGTSVTDTLKRVDDLNTVINTLDRTQLWRAFTPQLFPVVELAQALKQSNEVTDEASAIERAGGGAFVMQGAADNIKITHPEDLRLAQLILQAQSSE